MTFEYDAAGALARIKAGLSQRAEDQKPEGNSAKLANPAKAGSAAQGGLADLASLAPVHPGKCASGMPRTPGMPPEGSAPVPADAAAALARREGFKERAAIVALRRPPAEDWSTEDWQTHFNERAAIAEYDGKLSRPEAEALALACCTSEWLHRHAVTSPPGPCPICGDADRPNDPLLPVGIAGAGEVWLHIGCSTAWRTAREAEAVAALAAMGITGLKGRST
jgi:hypothetical protein